MFALSVLYICLCHGGRHAQRGDDPQAELGTYACNAQCFTGGSAECVIPLDDVEDAGKAPR